MTSGDILARVQAAALKPIDLTLRPAYFALLEKLGNPQKKLPCVIHVAGTNGKGSTCAFMRAILEAAGYLVNVYTSPHLVRFHERIRIHGRFIEEDELVSILQECERHAAMGDITYFEFTTAACFKAFADHPADVTIVEVGMGGRLDATNVFDAPAVTAITRISMDHREYLGDTIAEIAAEKAGIIKTKRPCVIAQQPDKAAEQVLLEKAAIAQPVMLGGRDWQQHIQPDGRWLYEARQFSIRLPAPALLGQHQYENAGVAIAALMQGGFPLRPEHFVQGMAQVEWPARLQQLRSGPALACLPSGWELWLDGAHNDSAGAALAQQAQRWHAQDRKPLDLIFAMMENRQPSEMLAFLVKQVGRICAVPIPDQPKAMSVSVAAEKIRSMGVADVWPERSVISAVSSLVHGQRQPRRILICGSLYLAGHVLHTHA